MTERLRPSDPARIGGHRLLGRLGAGGMGTVYLGRTDAGALAAVKVILPEYAGDEEFRTRFRREAEAARRVDSPWAVRVTGADTESETPWLATEFVPGPTLPEVVARYGPLPARSVKVLGRLLARALAAVHAAGLAHRDVKPGNVLLAADGPRLIDFGIARAADATALTATGLVVGTPGFLPPEQAPGSGADAGPAGDVFSLGALLAYAATGRPPFGSGAVDALLYRTVHDAPDLDGVDDPALRALLTECLAKDPAARPSAADLDTRITEDVPAGGASASWLPEDVVRTIAERSAAMLALPDIDATVGDAAASDTPEPRTAPARRRFLAFAAGGAVVALGAGGLAAARLWGDGADGRSGATTAGRRWVIGVHADLTGDQKAAGRAQERGVRLAVDRFNSRKDKPFTLTVKALDDRGDPARAERVAEEFARDPDVLAVIGPTGDAATGAALPAYDEAVLPLLTVSSLQIAYAARVNAAFFQASPSYAALSLPIVTRLLRSPGAGRLGILIDRSGGQAAYQAGYAANLMVPGLTGGTTHPRVVPAGTTDLAPVVADLLAHRSDALLYAGDAAGAARAARALAATPFKGPRVAQHTAMRPEFLKRAGEAAEGWEFIAPFTGADMVGGDTASASARPAADFAAAHRERFGAAPDAWAAEAYDVAGLVAREAAALVRGAEKSGAEKNGAGKNGAAEGGSPTPTGSPGTAPPGASPSGDGRPGRAALAAAIAASRYEGISRTYAFDAERQQLVARDAHLHRVEGGRFRYVGPAPQPKG
ncbi:bifunctional serine/threonine-protein kinase/ABC transporter substrate-binding protein [Streptomyces sp. OUCMDZ-4982]|uniref:bifunctional serine/threonine-protein kinase/ABC transporter substrate-binding protein n=1 Tax=Streptomyces sp. OUCMDZ-4982 TaxID=2973090 RepID=UPI00215C9EF7|nr:bifunctional serine/threonine-protein kinase/ABC transporter substrate-binding protein [Streptomyces sp. OUCMDZ-4982]MCR8946195.1 bifunctional serine/threonine-protein kinase/ABC transporter substrate-binding protein [Streptomyces sp. OUCMDZ-4982]